MAGLSARDAIEGVKYARQLNKMNFEYDRCVNDLERMKQEIYNVSNELKALTQEKNSLRNQVEVLKEAKAGVWNEIDTIQRTREISPSVRTRRRRFRHARAIGIPQEQRPTL